MKNLLPMGKNLKYIKINGVMTACGTYDAVDVDIRPYEAVTIKDDSGEEVHFRMLMIPARLDDKFNINQATTFYILRHKDKKGQYVGALYAINVENEKIFYALDAWKAIKTIARMTSTRGVLTSNPMVLAFLGVAGGLFFYLIIYLILGQIFGNYAVFPGFAAAAFWIYFLLFPTFKSKLYAGESIMLETMRADGFVPRQGMPQATSSNKY